MIPNRWAVSTVFFVNGAVLASWVPHIPWVKDRHALTDGELGLVLLCMAIGAVAALPLAGALVVRFGSRRTTSLAAIALCLLMPLPIVSPSVPLSCVALLALGAANGTLDVSMNAQAIVVERQYGRPIMSSFHALFSLGGLFGAGVAAVAMARHVSEPGHVLVTALIAIATLGLVLGSLVPSPTQAGGREPAFALPGRRLLALGALAFFALLAEGAMGDWSGVYLHDELGAGPAVAATGFAVFSLAMAVGRLSGDRLVARFGAGRTLQASGAMAALGFGAALLAARPLPAVLGCGTMGLGIANAVPILFSGAGRVEGTAPATGLAAVATMGYCGLLAGPPLIGLLAERTGLSAALGMVSVFCGLIALGARAVPAVRTGS